MAMSTQLMVASAIAGLNAAMLLALTVVWARNYRTFRTPLILGLMAFGSVMLVENLVALYFFFSTHVLYAMGGFVGTVVAILRGLQFVAIVFLTYVTMK